MTKIKEKLRVASQDEDALKVLEQFGLTKDMIEGFEELEKPATLDEAIKNFNLQSDFDKRVDKALKTREENLKAKYNFVEKEQEDPKKEKPKSEDPAIQALLDELSDMKKWRQEQEQEKQKLSKEQKRSNFVQNLKDKGIPAVYVHELDLDKDFEEQFETVSKKFEEDGGAFKDQKTATRLPFPKNTGNKNEPPKKEVDEFNDIF